MFLVWMVSTKAEAPEGPASVDEPILPDAGSAGGDAAPRSLDPALLEALIEHTPRLSTPKKPSVPAKDRDRPADAELVKRILSRDPICRIPGCRHISERAHHVDFLEHGGRTNEENMVGLCIRHHHMVHAGLILMSGTAYDLRISDADRRPIISFPISQASPVEIAAERSEGPSPPASPDAVLSPKPSQKPSPEPVSVPFPVLRLPAEIDRGFWRSHRSCFEWSERRKALAYRPEIVEEWIDEPAPGAPAPAAAAFAAPALAPAQAPAPAKNELSTLKDFEGERRVVENLSLALEAARLRGELPPPILLSGPPGLGKSSLSKLIARELASSLHHAQGPSLVDLGSLLAVLPDLEKGSVLFIDEIHRLPAAVAEILYQALDEGALSIPVVAGARIQLVKLRLEPFVLIGATTEESLLPGPLRSRFAIRERLEFYAVEDLERIAASAARGMGIELTAEARGVLARGARGTPRLLLAHLARARDLALVEGRPGITAGLARRALERAGIDRSGLSATDRRILEVLIERGRPVSVRSLADLLGESPRTVSDVYEPYLLREGYLARTWRGRTATEKAGRALLRSVIDGLEIDFGDFGKIAAG